MQMKGMRGFRNALFVGGALFLGVGLFQFTLLRHEESQVKGDQVVLKLKRLDVGMWPAGLANGAAIAAFQKDHPNILLRRWTSFRIPGDFDVASELMSFAARSAPDVTMTYIHRMQFYVDQGFFHKLNDFIGTDKNKDGVLEPSEIRWKPWLQMPPRFRQLGTKGTDIYALPVGLWFSLVAYRPDILMAAGVDPNNFPKEFSEFFRVGQKICAFSLRQHSSRRIYALPRDLDGIFLSLVYSQKGTLGVGDIIGHDGKTLGHLFPDDDAAQTIRSLGLRPVDVKIKWRASFDNEPVRNALEAVRELCWKPWIVDPATGDPLDISPDDLHSGVTKDPRTGREIVLSEVAGGVQYGICNPGRSGSLGESNMDQLRSGDVAMLLMQNDSAAILGKEIGRYGFALPPALDAGGEQSVIAIPALYGINSDLDGPKLGAAWQFLSFQCGPDWSRITSQYLIDHGYIESVSPLDAKRFGFTDALERMSKGWIEINQRAMENAHIIPYFSGFQQAQTELLSRTVHKLADTDQLDIPETLRNVQHDVEFRILRPPGTDRGIFETFVSSCLLLASILAIGWGILCVVGAPQSRRLESSVSLSSNAKIIFWLFITPALISVLLWNYYPAFRGFLLAFQEYRLSGDTKWVGLANFVEGAWSARFWYTIWNSIQFIGLNVVIGFMAPIGLAVLLNEIPRGKYVFRTIFFLPAVTSSLVIMLLWVVMYEPSPEGIFNRILKPFVIEWNQYAPAIFDIDWPVQWLRNPHLAMICVIIPGIWAVMGTGCLIYLAALQSVSSDLYEAAEIDGAGFVRKLRHVTIPYLRPLLVINFVGAFIGSAHGWGNIFVMTGGGPDLSTQVAALEIWTNSFVFLRFGMATAQAWVLGALLIGFTVWQIRLIRKVDFRKPKGA